MLLKKTLCFLTAALFCFSAHAQENKDEPATLKANFRRVGLDISSTNVSHAREYENSPVAQLSADSQTVVKGVFDFLLEYNHGNTRWNNGIYAEYGKTKIKPAGEPSETNENADKILLSSDYAHKMLKFRSLDFGPMVNAEYQTEFTANDNAPRMQVLRGKAGMKLFDGKIIKDFYIAGVAEYDMTYSDAHVSKSAGEIGWRIEDKPRDGVSFSTDGYYRKYFSYSRYVGTDLKYDLNLTARMDVNMTNTLTFGPYVSYRLARSREANVAGSNFMIGLSFTYKDLFDLM